MNFFRKILLTVIICMMQSDSRPVDDHISRRRDGESLQKNQLHRRSTVQEERPLTLDLNRDMQFENCCKCYFFSLAIVVSSLFVTASYIIGRQIIIEQSEN